ncbi:uncharacterized protein LAJ45_10955 [Morchella importuna]|uniref:Uncharacterized protein n=1 Tax=Morchella conica CCBAS932 TaxID=1392247 RepID=A0A3N4KHK1_9PEZI|nr:uncharacterized protein LAJ45_10955 [Morchella importuna]KAH8145044.1 hypothetical protein LAJ45_10955 [Morchella importuna]RPB10033.1 hypothetical protein P167DRAFT_280822 [Morchella conica CCBAS932]
MAPRAAPDDDGDNTSEHRAQPPYGATHPPNLFHHEVEGMPIWGIIVIVALIILLLALISYIVYTQLRARRLGLPAPSWRTYVPFIKNNKRSAPSSYEPARGGAGFVGAVKGVFGGGNTGYSGAGARSARTREALDPDQAWDSRMVDEEDISYTGGGYGQRSTPDSRGRYGEAHQMQEHRGHEEPERGRSRSREPPRRSVPPPYPNDDATNPFAGDIRRPESEGFVGNNVRGGRPSVESERRSVFRESIT